MSFTLKAILADYCKKDGTHEVCLRVTVDRKAKPIGLGFHVREDQWDALRQEVRTSHPNYIEFNREIARAKEKSNRIASDYRINDRLLRLPEFMELFSDSSNRRDFLLFARRELKLRKPLVDPRTYQQNEYALEKLEKFQSRIMFNELNVEMIQRYVAFERKTWGNVTNTINKTLTTWKLYLNAAERKGIKFENPFKHYRMEKAHVHKTSLTNAEFLRLVEYYLKTTHPGHKKTLQCFLFSCLTSLRVSDMHALSWNNIHGDYMMIKVYKNRKKNKVITIPLLPNTLFLLPKKEPGIETVFQMMSEPYMNRVLKDIADACDIKKNMTYHMSRHSFATLFLEMGGSVEVLQQILGHSEIKTTMIYTHITDARKRQQMEAFDNLIHSVKEKKGS